MNLSGETKHVRCLLDSFRRWTGRDLLPGGGSQVDVVERLFSAPFVVVSHGAEEDPVLNYGNRMALQLWEMTLEDFLRTPSRLTAEVPNREERAKLLREVTQNGFIDNYAGIRVSKSGRRFRIEGATVWNLLDDEQKYCGQAATFSSWIYL